MSNFKPFKKVILLFGLLIFLTVAGFFVWWHLPVTINRHSDIEFGNKLIKNIGVYKRQNGLPNTNDWTTLKKLGFKFHNDVVIPDYQKINDTTYELTYIEGFDGPYLLWTSDSKQWKLGNPIIVDNHIDEEIISLVEQQQIVIDKDKELKKLSSEQRGITLVLTLQDTTKNIYLVKAGEYNGTNLVTYYNFFVDANKMTILNPTGKVEGQ